MKFNPVDFAHNAADHQCAFMAALGFSNRAIIKRTSLSVGQISYRLKKARISRMDYRDGTSSFAAITFKVVSERAEVELARHLQKHLTNGEY